jgi:hypothetical protein
MPACRQATGYKTSVNGDQALLPSSNTTQNLGARRARGSLVVAGALGLKRNETSSLSAKCR